MKTFERINTIATGLLRWFRCRRLFVSGRQKFQKSIAVMLVSVLVFSAAFSFPTQAGASQTDIFSTAGFASWTAPAGVTSAIVACWGGGGAGFGGTIGNNGGGGAGGGGGAFASSTVAVTAGTQYTIFIGAGGATSGAYGATSTFATTTVLAAPGWGGRAVLGAHGLGGAVASSTGTTIFAGGRGGNGVDGGTASDWGGGGGGAGGPHGGGNNGANGATGGTTAGGQGDATSGGAGGTGSGNGTISTNGGGGGGGAPDNAAGGSGATYGAGGGGAGATGGFGSGATGACTVTYDAPPTVTTDAVSTVGTGSATLNGNITATGGNNGTSRGFATSTNATLSSSVSTTTETGSFSTGAFSTSSTGLSPNTTYYTRAFATNVSGTSYGGIQSYLTLPGVPGTPTYLNTFATTTGITWSVPSGGATSYKLQQCITGSATCSLFTGLASNSTTTYGLTANTSYDYAVRATNAAGESTWSATSTVVTISGTTTLANATDPSNATIAPGEVETFAGAFTLQTNTGSSTISAFVVDLGSGASAGIKQVEITSNAGTTTYGTVSNPSSDTPTIAIVNTLTATTGATIYKIRVTPKSHANMPNVPGATYSVQAKISSFTASGGTTGSDTAGATITIDNTSPNNVSGATVTPGQSQNSLSWTNPGADFSETVVLRATSTIATSTYEGTLYSTSGSFTDISIPNLTDNSAASARLSSTTLAFVDNANDRLAHYTFNGSSWVLTVASTSIIVSGNEHLAALDSTTVAFIDLNHVLKTYRFTGAAWVLVGSASIGGSAGQTAITAMNATDVALAETTSDTLRLFRFDGSTWTQVGNSLSLPALSGPAITSLNATDVAYISENGDTLSTYRFDGTDWTLVGSGLTISSNAPHIGTLSSTSIAFIENDIKTLRTYVFNGSTWVATGNGRTISYTGGAFQITGISGTDIAATVTNLGTLNTYRFDGTNWSQNKNVVGDATVVYTGTGTSFNDTGLTNGTAYHYKIFSRDAYGNYATGTVPTGSPATPAATAPTLSTTAASSVTATSSVANGNITDTGGSNATSRGFATSTNSTVSSSVSTSTATGDFGTGAFTGAVSGLTGNTTYYFRAYATNPTGTGYGSIESFLTPPNTPGTPTYTSITATTTAISWTNPSGAASYSVEQCVNGTGTCNLFTGVSGLSTTTYGLTGNTDYDYAVRGTNATGNSFWSATSTVRLLPNVPSTPTVSTTTYSTITLAWNAPSGGAASYKVERCAGSGCTDFAQIAVTVVPQTYEDTGLSSVSDYRYRIRATNTSGDGLYNGSVGTTTLVAYPATIATNAASNVVATSSTLNANITAIGSASPTIRGFASSTNASLVSGVATTSESGSFTTGAFTGSMGGLSGNSTYYFRAYTTNVGGTSFGTIESFLTPPNIPGTPSFANVSHATLSVSWTGSTGSSTSYKLERCTGSSCTDFVQIASGILTTSYNDTDLTEETTYRYIVRGTNATGDGLYGSAGSVTTISDGISTGGGGGGGGGIGGDAPAGQGTVGGGGNSGGESIGNDPNFFAPSSNAVAWGGGWTNPANAYSEDGAYATTNASAASDYGFAFSVPSGNSVLGIAVKLLAFGSSAAGSIGAELSWNSGTATTTSAFSTGTLTTGNVLYTLGGASSLWGHSWIPAEFADFRLRLVGVPSSNTLNLDAIQVRIYHQASGGGGGGGGEI